MDASVPKKRILIVGGGFGGVTTARHLERLFRRRPDVEIVLVSRDRTGHGQKKTIFGQLLLAQKVPVGGPRNRHTTCKVA